MPSMTERANWADAALERFAEVSTERVAGDDVSLVSDLLADVMHWADQEALDFLACLRRAQQHYHKETKEHNHESVYARVEHDHGSQCSCHL